MITHRHKIVVWINMPYKKLNQTRETIRAYISFIGAREAMNYMGNMKKLWILAALEFGWHASGRGGAVNRAVVVLFSLQYSQSYAMIPSVVFFFYFVHSTFNILYFLLAGMDLLFSHLASFLKIELLHISSLVVSNINGVWKMWLESVAFFP